MFADIENPSVLSYKLTPSGKGYTVKLQQGGKTIAEYARRARSWGEACSIGDAMLAAAKSQRNN